MAWVLRVNYPHAIYHVLSRGNERRKIFWEAEDYVRSLRIGSLEWSKGLGWKYMVVF